MEYAQYLRKQLDLPQQAFKVLDVVDEGADKIVGIDISINLRGPMTSLTIETKTRTLLDVLRFQNTTPISLMRYRNHIYKNKYHIT